MNKTFNYINVLNYLKEHPEFVISANESQVIFKVNNTIYYLYVNQSFKWVTLHTGGQGNSYKFVIQIPIESSTAGAKAALYLNEIRDNFVNYHCTTINRFINTPTVRTKLTEADLLFDDVSIKEDGNND